ncbi:MAG: MFS transporter [candidate division KSB1 bacterium]|nr:MFS transporter [candidate division KSB1 bacterium]MDZ7274760.1 MFS transporter [candidate division KSB1 bacterium]MDZ7285585.1 MFS transporter [candidate division KSB1 bacterium]MDZ7298617.1 MFS transporter [candidate division KSB1 bacterium]MDZ7307626.1 MFS transporter [candidate division KSB1 bacterium]
MPPAQTITWRNGFQPAFWIANVLELFERFAFYGSKAVLAVYLANTIGLGAQAAGSLAGLYSGLIFSLPIIAGTFVDRYGFRPTLMVCFAMFALGYFLIGLAGMPAGQGLVQAFGKTGYLTAVLILTAIGGSLIKPCIVGTVAKTSHPEVKALGYSIYYTLVNLGGAIGPILALQVREGLGIQYVLVMSSLTSLLLLLATFLFFKEPEAGEAGDNRRTLGQVFRDMLLVFRNFRFISFLVIFSGFWIMFWQIFYSFPFYVTEVLHFPRFELLETIDAWTIIVVGVPMTALVKKWRPITAMTLGFALASCCWLIIAGWPTVTAAILGIALFAFGEATQAPRFYEYVAGLAPREQVGTFMGFAFLPVAIGAFVGGPLGGWLVQQYLRDTLNPAMMWYMVAAVGFVATALMLLYNKFFTPKN